MPLLFALLWRRFKCLLSSAVVAAVAIVVVQFVAIRVKVVSVSGWLLALTDQPTNRSTHRPLYGDGAAGGMFWLRDCTAAHILLFGLAGVGEQPYIRTYTSLRLIGWCSARMYVWMYVHDNFLGNFLLRACGNLKNLFDCTPYRPA